MIPLALFPRESPEQIYAHIARLRLEEIERERQHREDMKRESRCRRESIEYTSGRE